MEAGTKYFETIQSGYAVKAELSRHCPFSNFEHKTNRAALSITLLLNNTGEVFESDMKARSKAHHFRSLQHNPCLAARLPKAAQPLKSPPSSTTPHHPPWLPSHPTPIFNVPAPTPRHRLETLGTSNLLKPKKTPTTSEPSIRELHARTTAYIPSNICFTVKIATRYGVRDVY
jgi:hypothetical protein